MERDKRTTFNQVAELYHDVRTHYPEELFRDLLSLSLLPPDARILEIGAGTGIATFPLAKRGYQITAVEMGKDLAQTARKNLAQFSKVTVVNAPFEEWELPTQPFDLVMSATAFHWIDKNIRFKKSAAALCPAGSLALFRYSHVAGGDRDFFEQSQSCYQQYIPDNDPNFRLPEIGSYQSEYKQELRASGLFCSPEMRTYVMEEIYTRSEYIKLLSTYSNIIALEKSVRDQFLNCIGTLVDQHFNGQIRKCYLTELVVAKKK